MIGFGINLAKTNDNAATSAVQSNIIKELHTTILRPNKFTPTSVAGAGADTRASKRRTLRQQD